jgi:hypothetical protein
MKTGAQQLRDVVVCVQVSAFDRGYLTHVNTQITRQRQADGHVADIVYQRANNVRIMYVSSLPGPSYLY